MQKKPAVICPKKYYFLVSNGEGSKIFTVYV